MCCDEIIHIGCFLSCETTIKTNITANQTGEYTINLKFNNQTLTKKITLQENDKIELPNTLNEDYIYQMQIIRPDGTKLPNCYQFKISINQNL